jgi:hypothetical protein
MQVSLYYPKMMEHDNSRSYPTPPYTFRLKAIHPAVERVRAKLLPPSPVSCVHDKEQPSSGVLSRPEPRFYQKKQFDFCQRPQHLKSPCLVGKLNLQDSGLFSRRKK